MKKTFALLLCALMLLSALVLAGCQSKGNPLETIQKNGVLKVYTEAGFPPYEFYYNNEIIGVDVAIMKAVAEKIGVTVEVSDVDFNTICTSVQSGKADCGAAGITISDERKESVDFSIPYSSTEQYLIISESNADIKSIEDLKGKVIGVQEGTTSDLLIDEKIQDGTLEGATLTPYKTPALAAAALNKLDAVVTDKLTAQIIVSNGTGMKALPLVDADGQPVADIEEYGIAVAKGNTELLAVINEVIEGMLKDGTMDQMVEEYSAKAAEVDA